MKKEIIDNITKNQNKILSKIKKYFKWIIFCLICVGIGFGISSLITKNYTTYTDYEEVYADPSCNVAGINLHGSMLTYIPLHADGDTNFDYNIVSSEDVLWYIQSANNNPNIKAIVLEVDSAGGSPVAGEEISNAIKNSEKPVVGFIRETGVSAAYWAVSGAYRIWASKNSDVGGVGVTMSYLNNVENNRKEGYAYEQLSSGKFKDSGSPDLPLTKEEKDLFMRDINIIHQNFIETVSANRNIPLEEVRKIADGSTVLGDKAKELKLIDEIGGINEVKKYLEETLGEKPNICW
jgi:protease-4